MGTISSICVFSGSTIPHDASFVDKTIELGRVIASEGIKLVYGGGNRGLMGVLASTVRENAGHVIGVLPRMMDIPEVRTKDNESELIIASGMHERKSIMYDRADAFIALPGGIGTLEELFESYTWKQLGLHQKPVLLFNINGFYDRLLEFLDECTEAGFISAEVRASLLVADTARDAISLIAKDRRILPDKLR